MSINPPLGLDPVVYSLLWSVPLVAGSARLFVASTWPGAIAIGCVCGLMVASVHVWLVASRAGKFLHATRVTRRPMVARRRPTVVVYVPGLMADKWPSFFPLPSRWLWDEDGEPSLSVRRVLPPYGLDGDLGSPAYVAKVRAALVEAAATPGARVLAVGESRGAGVLLRALAESLPAPLVGAVFLMGPYDSVRSTVQHRFGATAARLFGGLAERLFHPAAMDLSGPHAGVPAARLFVTSKQDRALNPDGVRTAHRAVTGRLLELERAPHSLMWATTGEMLRVRLAVDDLLARSTQ